ncbi:MAG: dTDP-4-amino-4,6-dideoxygalactose transaminase [Saprospiraceae bacterium]
MHFKNPISIPFNIPFDNLRHFQSIIPGDVDLGALFKGNYAERVSRQFQDRYNPEDVVLTGSCTNALELAALLLDLKPGDEVIIPAYTYVSTANAFELRGATLVLCDSATDSPNMDLDHLETLIGPKTKAIVVVHYAGVSVDMHRLVNLAQRHGIVLIEDAAHAIDARYDDALLGTFGDLTTFSFHETKNITCGQGGALLINNPKFVERARILRDCGTNRHNFILGLVDRYTWVDAGSVYNLSELNCAYLAPQLQHIEMITRKRVQVWEGYYQTLLPLQERGLVALPTVGKMSQHNAHIFHIVLKSQTERDKLLEFMRNRGICTTFHYGGLHLSPYYQKKYGTTTLVNAEKFAGCLLRLPLYFDLSVEDQIRVLNGIVEYFSRRATKTPMRNEVYQPKAMRSAVQVGA